MRILIASDQWFPEFKGGSARIASDIAVQLARRGHEVTVLAPRVPHAPRVSREGSLVVQRVLIRAGLPQTFADPVATWRHARLLRERSFDVLLAHQATTAVGLAAARLDAPLALVYHASALRELRFLRSRLPHGGKRAAAYALDPAVRLLDRRAVAKAARILVLSEFTCSLLAEDHPRSAASVVRVPGAVDVAAFTPGDGPSDARSRLGLAWNGELLLTVRRLEPRMGLEQLLRALPPLGRRREVALAIVGDGFLAAPLRRLAAEIGVERRVFFVGAVPEAELREWYRAADLFVLPTAAYEGFGLATAEALASGTPVVGTPVGATPELLLPLEPGLVARDSGEQALAEAIEAGLGLVTPEFRARCRSYACARFSIEQAAGDWERALAELVGRQPSGDA